MSASSIRRLKERGGGGAKIVGPSAATAATAAVKYPKSFTPQSEKSVLVNGGDSLRKKPAGKENPRPTSRGRAASATAAAALSQKPIMKAMPRIDKASAANGGFNGAIRIENRGGEIRAEGRPRWSTSSAMVPSQRGRSPSPSEFNRVLSSSRSSRASSVEKKRGNSRENVKSDAGKYALKNSVKNNEIPDRKVVNLSSESVKFKFDDADENLNLKEILKTKPCLGSDVEFCGQGLESGRDSSGGLSLKGSSMESKSGDVLRPFKQNEVGETTQKMVKKSGGSSGTLKGKEGNEDKKSGSCVGGKYPSKLHEKLAFLEGKVKRIATDIKRTKEMLDMNNTDSSKVILSDIQEKISGIEKAMSHVVNNDDKKASVEKSNENDDSKAKLTEVILENKMGEGKSSVTGLNADELEARLFPHHKLLRDRKSLKSSGGNADISEAEVGDADGKLNEEQESVDPVDEHPIAKEFLASLRNEKYVGDIRIGNLSLSVCDVQETDASVTSTEMSNVSQHSQSKAASDINLMTDERLEDFDSQESRPALIIEEEAEDSFLYKLNEIGRKATTGGWFVSEGESVLLAHDDGSCSLYDVVNCEGKAIYKPPTGVSPNMWGDCWLVRAPSADGCSGRYVVAASAGNSAVSGFCCWDLYSKEIRAFHTENGNSSVRTALAPLPNNSSYRRNVMSASTMAENKQWWYRPCGPLIASAASGQRMIRVYDVRDGEPIMRWELQKSVSGMEYSSPLHWRNRGRVVIAESEAVSLWDVSSLHPEAVSSVSSSNRTIVALHVNNTDAELGGGVRQRVSSAEEGNDGVFCTPDSINVLDFRITSGIALKIPKVGVDIHSTFSRGDSIFLGCTNLKSVGGKQYSSQIQQYSLRKGSLCSIYDIPASNAHRHFTAITQVWGNAEHVMGVSGQGLFIFDTLENEVWQALNPDSANSQNVKEVIGSNDLYCPSFDYLGSRVLLVSRDRPALWKYLL
ncbi:OLC1v1019659C1 [Oldenlandia corymbosa var. corymbosa]|uniref:OLC1v1019659C1 n=1 Tax=Oldenlandia corymbosa var. corymbosa TaxID=529605 RepID=A0AAV1EEQ4_OLDCO|nr:OLC1v1019659C1 [Oldenlandia corymbosa var. corymbosa]